MHHEQESVKHHSPCHWRPCAAAISFHDDWEHHADCWGSIRRRERPGIIRRIRFRDRVQLVFDYVFGVFDSRYRQAEARNFTDFGHSTFSPSLGFCVAFDLVLI